MPCSAEWTPTLFTVIIPLSTVGEQMLGKAWFCDWREVAPFAFFKCSARPNESFWKFVYFLPSVSDHMAPQVSWLTKWLTTFWASVVLHSTLGEHVRFQRASHTKWLVALDTIVCSFFAVSDYAPPQISCLIEWLNTCASCLHCWWRMSLNFDLVLLRSGTFNTVAFGKLTRSSILYRLF